MDFDIGGSTRFSIRLILLAAMLASGGATLPMIGALLGHSSASTTQRYAHLLDAPLREATEKAGAALRIK